MLVFLTRCPLCGQTFIVKSGSATEKTHVKCPDCIPKFLLLRNTIFIRQECDCQKGRLDEVKRQSHIVPFYLV